MAPELGMNTQAKGHSSCTHCYEYNACVYDILCIYKCIYIYIHIWYPARPQRSTKFNAITDIAFGRSLERESAQNHFGIIFDSGNLP